jgi:hypothetical protein
LNHLQFLEGGVFEVGICHWQHRSDQPAVAAQRFVVAAANAGGLEFGCGQITATETPGFRSQET